MNHYTYKVILPETNEYYIGVRSCKCLPEEDSYMGSMKTWKVDKSKLIKHIYTTFESREEANEWESLAIETCIDDPLNRNYFIPNLRFHMLGYNHTKEAKEKIGKAARNMSQETRKKLSESKKGNSNALGFKHTEETKNKISEKHKGELNGMYGKKTWMSYNVHNDNIKKIISEKTKLSMNDDIKKRMSQLKIGKKFYTNGIKIINVFPGTEPQGFVPGRKLK